MPYRRLEQVLESMFNLCTVNDSDDLIAMSASKALGRIPIQISSKVLPVLVKLIPSSAGGYVIQAIDSIQSRCKYYNHELEIERKAIDPTIETITPSITYQIGSIGNFNAGDVTIKGDQIAEQHNHSDLKT